MTFSIITLFLTILYCIFILYCYYNWKKIEDRSGKAILRQNIKVSVIIPFRNEADNLPRLIQSLKSQNYPRENYQIILVDDHSTDQSMEVAIRLFQDEIQEHVIVLKTPKESKKEAITFAVGHSSAELIVTTDADTNMTNEWLTAIVNEYVATDAALICGPVRISGSSNYAERLQEIEFCGLTAMGAASIEADRPMFCNGANLAFKRVVFNVLKGYENSRSSTGDDTQLMMKIHRSGLGKIIFLKDKRAIVETGIVENKSDLIQQRRRWASKIPLTLSAFTVTIAMLSWLVHAMILVLIIYSIIQTDYLMLLFVICIKSLVEILFLKSAGRFYMLSIPSWMIFIAQPIYCFYIFYVGLIAPFSSYEWKGRKGN